MKSVLFHGVSMIHKIITIKKSKILPGPVHIPFFRFTVVGRKYIEFVCD